MYIGLQVKNIFPLSQKKWPHIILVLQKLGEFESILLTP